MANLKITDLPLLVAPGADDLVEVVDDPGVVPASYHATIGSLLAIPHNHIPTDIVGTAVITTDGRLGDARAPTAHAHPQSDVTSLVADLALKAPLASPAFTGTPTGLTKAHVGLGSVDNVADASKPVSTAQQAALNLKANIASPVFTGGGAITQTYATASATHAAVTQLVCPAGGTGTAAGGWSTAANRNLAVASINAAMADIANVKQVLNQVIDQLQARGLLQ